MSDLITTPIPPETDHALLDGAVAYLNRAIHSNGLKLAIDISQYITATFFGGDPSVISNHDPHKTASFRALCAHPDLQMGASTLHRLVRIGHQARHLPADLSEQLSLSHHRALLSVEPATHKQHLAREAVQHGWSVDALEAKIAAEHPQPAQRPGRPPKSPVLKWLGAVGKAAGGQQSAKAFAADFAKLTVADQVRAKAELQALRGRLDTLLAAVAS